VVISFAPVIRRLLNLSFLSVPIPGNQRLAGKGRTGRSGYRQNPFRRQIRVGPRMCQGARRVAIVNARADIS
jgi:hypothetical protein